MGAVRPRRAGRLRARPHAWRGRDGGGDAVWAEARVAASRGTRRARAWRRHHAPQARRRHLRSSGAVVGSGGVWAAEACGGGLHTVAPRSAGAHGRRGEGRRRRWRQRAAASLGVGRPSGGAPLPGGVPAAAALWPLRPAAGASADLPRPNVPHSLPPGAAPPPAATARARPGRVHRPTAATDTVAAAPAADTASDAHPTSAADATARVVVVVVSLLQRARASAGDADLADGSSGSNGGGRRWPGQGWRRRQQQHAWPERQQQWSARLLPTVVC